jgi:hypothetical protein
LYRVAAVVKDGGGNLATATVVLAKQGLTGCRALGAWVPHVTLCFAHKINGACNAAVLEAKRMNLEVSPPHPCLLCILFYHETTFMCLILLNLL